MYLAQNGPKEEKKRNHVQFLRITFPLGTQPESQTSQTPSPCVTNPESWRLQQVCLQTSVSSCGHRSCHTSRVTVSHRGCRIQRALRITTCTLGHSSYKSINGRRANLINKPAATRPDASDKFMTEASPLAHLHTCRPSDSGPEKSRREPWNVILNPLPEVLHRILHFLLSLMGAQLIYK